MNLLNFVKPMHTTPDGFNSLFYYDLMITEDNILRTNVYKSSSSVPLQQCVDAANWIWIGLMTNVFRGALIASGGRLRATIGEAINRRPIENRMPKGS